MWHQALDWINSDPAIDRHISIITSLIIAASLLAYIFKEFIYPSIRRWRLKYPVKAHFLITSLDRFELGYVQQDNEEHFTKFLVLPSHTHNLVIHFIWKAKLGFTQNELEFSFEGDRAQKPLFCYWFLPFIKIGDRTRKPGEYPGHYIDYHDNYHIASPRLVAKGQIATAGFRIATRGPGVYYLKIGIPADGVDGEADGTPGGPGLRVLVRNDPTNPAIRMRCYEHPHCEVHPKRVNKF